MKKIMIFTILFFLVSFFSKAQTGDETRNDAANQDECCKSSEIGIIGPLYEGQMTIKLRLDTDVKKQDIRIIIKKGKHFQEYEDLYTSGKKSVEISCNEKEGGFTVYLSKALEKDQLIILKTGKTGKEYPIVKVKEAPIKIRVPLLSGARVIRVYIQNKDALREPIMVSISSGEIKKININKTEKKENVEAHQCDVVLDSPLFEGQKVKIVAKNCDNEIISFPEVFVESTTINFGRLNTFFTFGSILSKKKNEFSQADLYLGFEMNCHLRNLNPPQSKWGIVAYLKALLTSISRIEEADQSATYNPDTPKNEKEHFLESKKAITVQGGLFFPINISNWRYHGDENGLFIAPIVKAGFHTYSEDTSSDATISDLNNIPNPHNLFGFFSCGLRLGHFKMWATNKVSPKLINHVDITVGKSGHIGVIEEENSGKFKFLWILYLEGRIKIPNTPILLGFDAHLDLTDRELPDDFRFIIGTRIDIGPFIGKLIYD